MVDVDGGPVRGVGDGERGGGAGPWPAQTLVGATVEGAGERRLIHDHLKKPRQDLPAVSH